MSIRERVQVLREMMKKDQIDAYIIPSSDFHESEYVGEYFKAREFISGFTGSAGTVVITAEEAGLWTDGRYFIQANKQLEDTGIKLFKSGEPDVPTIEEYLYEIVPVDGVLGFDGRVISAKQGMKLAKKLEDKKVKVVYEKDLIDLVWEERPSLSQAPAFLLDTKYCGKDFTQKVLELREVMKEKGVTTHVITTLDDIAWLFNLRGGDVKFNPVVLAYAVVTLESVCLFVDKDKLSEEIKAKCLAEGITLQSYEEIYEAVKRFDSEQIILLDSHKVNYAIYHNISKDIKILDELNPTMYAKAKKNEVELQSIRNSHLKDGVAFTKFMYWLKTNLGKMEITEISASEKLEALRQEQEGFIEPSFGTIAGYKEHAAMMHYSASVESNYTLEQGGLFLIDSGGQYYDGTTDITRTFALGEVSEELKTHFTAVVRGMINLSKARFLQGVRGYNLDMLARGPIWDLGLDYKCGTGHGVGFLLNVHESPNGFRWKIVPERNDSCELEEGMLTTNEPGIYIEGSHGIRIENELVVRKGKENEYGQFLEFETVTFAPIDLDGIDINQMNKDEKAYLNAYHEEVYDKVSPFLEEDEKVWLKVYT
ncbi:MAG: aminopeptidase P family protein, partial [Cellulosilyticaceae bacterium]